MNSALSGLTATSARAEITASNIANVNTPGYVRRSVNLSEVANSGGVAIDSISRNRDTVLIESRREVSSNLYQSEVLSEAWKTLSFEIGDTSDGPGLFQSVSDFENAIAVAAQTPESGTDASNLLEAAKTVTRELNTLSNSVRVQRAEADSNIANAIEFINQSLVDIDALNLKIQTAIDGSNHMAGLLDQREMVIDQIAEYLPVRAIERDDFTVDVLTPEGVFLVAGEPRTIEFQLADSHTPDQTLAGGQLSGLTVSGIDITPGATSYAAVSSGRLAGYFQLRDVDLPELSNQLDTIANDLITRFTTDVADPTLNPGDPGLFVDSDAAAGAGVASRIGVNSLVDPDQGGELWRLRDGMGATSEGAVGNATLLTAMLDAMQSSKAVDENGIQGRFTASDLSAHLSSLGGQQRVTHEANLGASRTEFLLLQEAEAEYSGVDIDTEMQRLLLIEQAYSANARVIDVTNQLIRKLMEI